MSEKNSPNNKNILHTPSRRRYISRLRSNVEILKTNMATPIHHKLIEEYEGFTQSFCLRYVIVEVILFVLIYTFLFYCKPSFVIDKTPSTTTSTTSLLSKQPKQKQPIKFNHQKGIFYSLLLSVILFFVLYNIRKKYSILIQLFGNRFDKKYL